MSSRHLGLPRSSSHLKTLVHLRIGRPDGSGVVWQENQRACRPLCDFADRLEVLRDDKQVAELLGAQELGPLAPMHYGRLQALDDGFALPGHALAVQLGGVRRAFRRPDQAYLLTLRLIYSGVAQVALDTDLVHGVHHLNVRRYVYHQGPVDLEAVGSHLSGEMPQHCVRDVILLLKYLKQGHLRQRGANDVRDVGFDLRMHVGELVHGVNYTLWKHGLLNSNLGRDEDVVFCLRVDFDDELHDAAADGAQGDAAP
mmetsp:Transcript_95299/g.273244  ORF Transcript_95299/g.273244 Transcript_95299/m.273244 type:complete len:256 (+) Transcript_95299:72-839(+)